MAFPFHDKASKCKKAKGDSFPDQGSAWEHGYDCISKKFNFFIKI